MKFPVLIIVLPLILFSFSIQSKFQPHFNNKPNFTKDSISLDSIDNFGEYQMKWAKVYSAHKMGFINSRGRLVVPIIYDQIFPFGEYKKDWALIELDSKFGFINNHGKEIVPPIYDHFDNFGELSMKWIKAQLNGKNVLLNRKGKLILSN